MMPYWINPSGLTSLPSSPIVSDESIANMVTEATTKCLNQRGRGDSSNLFESVAEISKTLQMVSQPIKTLHKLVSKAAKTRREGIQALGRDYNPASLWLQYRYGIVPVIKDIEGILRGIERPRGLVRQTVRGNVSSHETLVVQSQTVISPMTSIILRQTEDDVTVRAMSLDEYVADLSSNVGFTTKGLITVPYELMKLSFVLDWLVNVGDYLGAIVPAFGLKQLGSCVVTKRKLRSTWTILSTSITAGAELVTSPSGVANLTEETTIRRSLGSPGIVYKSDFRLDNNVRLADAFSLLAQRMLRTFA